MKTSSLLIPCLLVSLASPVISPAEEKNKPAPGPARKTAVPPAKKAPRPEVSIQVEYIALEHAEVSELLSKHAGSADASALRKDVQRAVEEEEGEILETFWVRALSGQRAKVESIHETIYPTEYDPPEIPDELTLHKADPGSFQGTPANPAAFETRNVGSTLEIDPVLGADGETIDLNLVPEIVEHVEDTYLDRPDTEIDENSDIRMPLFYTMKVTTALTMKDGTYALIGVLRPRDDQDLRVMVFVRADALK